MGSRKKKTMSSTERQQQEVINTSKGTTHPTTSQAIDVEVIINALRDKTPVPTTQRYFQKPVDVESQVSFAKLSCLRVYGKSDNVQWTADKEDPEQQPFHTIRRKVAARKPPTTAADPDPAAPTATAGETLGFAGCRKCANGTGVQFVAVMRSVAPNYALPNRCALIALERNGNACILSLRAVSDLALDQLLEAIDSIAKLIPECPWDVVNKASYQPHKADLAPRFPQLQNRRHKVLRPVPQKLLPCTFQYARKGEQPVDSLEKALEATGHKTLQQWFFAFSGVSGIGKTVSALQFLDVLCANFKLNGQRVSIHRDHRFGIYMKYVYRNLTEEERCKKQVSVCAEALYHLLKDCAHHFDVPVTKVAMFYFVIDEIGGDRELVKQILAEETEFADNVKNVLRLLLTTGAGYSEAQLNNLFGTMRTPTGAVRRVFEVAFSVVGTGVGSLNDTGDNSLPDTYVHVSTKTSKMASDVFKQTMIKQFRVPSQKAQQLLEELQKDMLCNYLLTNARCAAYMAEVVWSVLELYSVANGISPASMIARCSLMIAHAVATKYMQANGWASISDVKERDRLRCALLSLAHTQEHGYYVVSTSDLRTLCVSVGAVEDYLTLQQKIDAVVKDDIRKAVDSDMGQRYQELCAKPVYSPHKAGSGLHPWMRRGANGKPLRFGLNPGVLVAVLLEEVGLKDPALELQTPGGMASVYERLVAVYMSMQINALHYYCMDALPSTGECEPEWKVPLVLVDRTAPDDVKLTLRGIEPWNRPVLPPIQSNNETLRQLEERADKIAKAVEKFGTVVELAGEGAARNDVTIYSQAVIHGMECKHYRNQDSPVLSFDVLAKRASQMGFTEVRIGACDDGIVRQREGGSGPATYKVADAMATSLFRTWNAAKMKQSFQGVEEGEDGKIHTAVFRTGPYSSNEGWVNGYHYTRIERKLRVREKPDVPCKQSMTIVSPLPVRVSWTVTFCAYQGTEIDFDVANEKVHFSRSNTGQSNERISINTWTWSLQTLALYCTPSEAILNAQGEDPQTTTATQREDLNDTRTWEAKVKDSQYCKLSWSKKNRKMQASLPVREPSKLLTTTSQKQSRAVDNNTAADAPNV